MKKQLLLFAIMLTPLIASAHDIAVQNTDGVTIYYNYINNFTELEVTFRGSSYSHFEKEYSGNVVIPEEVTFMDITRKVTSIASHAFRNCPGLSSVTIPNSVTSIGSMAFYGCGLTSVNIGNSVTSIGSYAFSGCSGLASITIPNSVTSIGVSAFYGCSGLTSVTINSNDIVSKAYSSSSPLGSIFGGQVQEYIIGEGVTSIGDYAFYGCSKLTSVTISNSVTSIGNSAFSGCSALTSVTVLNPTPVAITQNVFTNRKNATLYVPMGSKSAYKAANYWKEFKEIIIEIITFADANVKALCVANWDTNGNGELSEAEAAAVTDLGKVFNNNSTITSFNELRYFTGLTSIGISAFECCSNLSSIEIPNSVTSIGDYAFSRCYGLPSVTIPNSVTSIGNSAFYGCSVTSVTIPNSVTSIGDEAFSGCSGLTSIIVASGNTKYDSRNNCNAIIETASNTLLYGCKKTTIPNSVTSIGNSAFSWCSGLTSVTIPNSVTSIGDFAFSGCSGLTSVTIPNSVTSIGGYAFSWCSGLTSVTIGNSVTSIGHDAFNECSELKKVIVSDIGACCGIKFGNSTANPLYYAKHLYNDENTEITNLVIPNSVTSIGDYAFNSCSGLTTVTIPNSVTSIGDYAFSRCSGLTTVTIPNSVTSIGAGAFAGCSNLTSVTLNSNDVVSKAYTYSYNIKNIFGEQVKEYVIGDDVTAIGAYAFQNCSGLTSLTIGNGVTSIGINAFWGCTGLTSVTLNSNDIVSVYASSNNMKSIFGNQVKEYVIGDDVTAIGNNAFSGCKGLTSITIPNSVTSIGDYAFAGCSGLTSITIPNSVTSIGDYAFLGCSALTSVTIPNSVTSIGNSAFLGCSALTSVTIPNSVTSIGDSAFGSCSGLTSVTIPNSVTSIGDEAFSGCSGLTSVTTLNPTPVAITYYVFTNRTNATLYVPKGSKGAYQAANYWKEFKEINEIETTGIDQISFQENGEQGIDQEGAVWYTIDGKRVDKPKKGINIIRMSNGTTKKVVVK